MKKNKEVEMKTINKNLLVLKKQTGITDMILSQKLNLSVYSIHNKMTGKTDWKLVEVEQLCKIFNVGIVELTAIS